MFIGIDVGGYKINSVLVKNSKIIKRHRVLTKSKTNKKIIIGQIFDCIDVLMAEVRPPSGGRTSVIKGIGIGVPGPIDFKNQKVLNPPNVTGLKNVFLGKLVQKRFGIKTKIDNDTNCFTLAEAVVGMGKNNRVVAGLTLGTGVGGGIVIDKKIFHGASGSAGEFGHMVICKNNLEFYKKNNKYLGIGLANIVSILNPDIIVLGGGLCQAKKFEIESIRKIMKQNIYSSLAKNTKVVKAKFIEDAGALGTTLLFKK